MTPLLSIVTGTLDRPESLQRLIDSVVAHTAVEWEMVVADASAEPVVINDNRVRMLREMPRLGCVKGYNRAFRETRGEWVIWLNDDAEVLAGYADKAIAFMETHPSIGLGALPYSENGGPVHVNQWLGMVYANFGILRRQTGVNLGWFGNDIQMYGCDNALTCEVLISGLGVAPIPGANIVHHSVKDDHRQENQSGRARDNHILQEKYLPYRRQMNDVYRQHLPAECSSVQVGLYPPHVSVATKRQQQPPNRRVAAR